MRQPLCSLCLLCRGCLIWKKHQINLERNLWGYLKRMDTQIGYPIGVVTWYSKNHLYKCFQAYFLWKMQTENKNISKLYSITCIKFNNVMENKWAVVKNYHQILGTSIKWKRCIIRKKVLTVNSIFNIIRSNILYIYYLYSKLYLLF